MTLKRIAIAVLILWIVRNCIVDASQFRWPYLGAGWLGMVIGGTVADPRVWMLVIGIFLLNYREKKMK